MKRFGLPLVALVALIFAVSGAWKWRSVKKPTTPPEAQPTADYQHSVGVAPSKARDEGKAQDGNSS